MSEQEKTTVIEIALEGNIISFLANLEGFNGAQISAICALTLKQLQEASESSHGIRLLAGDSTVELFPESAQLILNLLNQYEF